MNKSEKKFESLLMQNDWISIQIDPIQSEILNWISPDLVFNPN